MTTQPLTADSTPDDVELARRIARGEEAAFEALMRRYNGRLFRVARAILKDDAEAEDALQEAYLAAYRHLADFRGGAKLSTWLTRIVINEALGRLRKHKRDRVIVPFGREERDQPQDEEPLMADETAESPESAVLRAELRRLLERRLDELPITFRTVFIMREVEEMTVEETAECLSIPAATVRTRLFRARALLRETLAREIEPLSTEIFGFAGERCDRVVAAVLKRFQQLDPHRPEA